MRENTVVVIKESTKVGMSKNGYGYRESHEKYRHRAFLIGAESGDVFIAKRVDSEEQPFNGDILSKDYVELATKEHLMQLIEGYIAGYITKSDMDNILT